MKNRLRKNAQKMNTNQIIINSNTDLLSEQNYKLIQIILEKIKKHEKSASFRQAAIRCFQDQRDKEYYKSIIKNPEDLGHITKKLNSKKYTNIQQFYDDLTQIWKNAQIFNQRGSLSYRDSMYMSKYVDKLFQENNLYDKLEHKKDEDINVNNNYNIINDEQNNNNKMMTKKRKRNNNEINDIDNTIKEIKEDSLNNKNNDNENEKEEKCDMNNLSFDEEEKKEDNNSVKNNDNPVEIIKNSDNINNLNKNTDNNNEKINMKNNNNNLNNYNSKGNNNSLINNIKSNHIHSSLNLILQKELIFNNMNFQSDEEKFIFLRNLIAKQLDKLSDENMFGLIEYIEKIRPEAILENPDNKINIDMNMFIEDTYSKLIDYLRDLFLSKLK